jgi:tRNA-splicing ligase RtcB
MPLAGLRRIDKNRIEVPGDYKPGMKTNGIIYVDEGLEKTLDSKSVDQVANVASLPGIVGSSLAMPDIHAGCHAGHSRRLWFYNRGGCGV